ncbi:hypothetical protein QUD33_20615, partial [Staphylococcus aureus]
DHLLCHFLFIDLVKIDLILVFVYNVYIIVVKEGQTLNIDEAIEIGQLTDVDEFKVTNAQSSIVEKVSEIKESWEGAIAQCLTTVD